MASLPIRGRRVGQLEERHVVLDDVVHLGNVNLRVAQRPGQILVDLQDHQVSGFHQLLLDHQREGERHIAALVGRRGRAPKDVEVVARGVELAAGGLMEVVGDVRHAALGVDFAVGCAIKPVLHEEMAGHLRLEDEIVQPQRQADPDRHVFQAVAMPAQLGQQAVRLRGRHGRADGLVRMDERDGFGKGEQFLPVKLLWIHASAPGIPAWPQGPCDWITSRHPAGQALSPASAVAAFSNDPAPITCPPPIHHLPATPRR